MNVQRLKSLIADLPDHYEVEVEVDAGNDYDGTPRMRRGLADEVVIAQTYTEPTPVVVIR